MAKPKFLKKLGKGGRQDSGIDTSYMEANQANGLKSVPTDPESPSSTFSGVEDQFGDLSISQQANQTQDIKQQQLAPQTGDLLGFDAPSVSTSGNGLNGESFLDSSNEGQYGIVPTKGHSDGDLLGFSDFPSASPNGPSPSSLSGTGDNDLLQISSSTVDSAQSAESGAKSTPFDPTAPSTSQLTVDAPLDNSKILDTGIMWARATPSKLVAKDWQEMSWMQYGETTLYLFRNRQDFMDWKHYSFHGGMALPEVRERLVKKRIDFKAELAKKNVQGYTLTQVNAKTYGQIGSVPLYNFKLDCWTLMGPITVAALGSVDKKECDDMHDRINEMYGRAFDQLNEEKEAKQYEE